MRAVIIGIIAVAVFLIFFRILKKPIKLFFKLIINSLIGLVMLMVFNLLGGLVSLHIGINLLTILISGILGLPGIILILILQMLL